MVATSSSRAKRQKDTQHKWPPQHSARLFDLVGPCSLPSRATQQGDRQTNVHGHHCFKPVLALPGCPRAG
eukprot:5386333-Amphidinium_carterae.1